MKKRVLPLSPKQTAYYLRNPEAFDVNRLEANEMLQGNGANSLAKIPQMKDRIRINDRGMIYLVVGRETDGETGGITEETVELGQSISNMLPGMMVTSDVYHEYFNHFGELINDPMRDESVGDRHQVTHGADESVGDRHQVTHWEEKIYAAEIEHTPMFNREIRNAQRGLTGEKLKKRIEEELREKNYVQIGELEFVRFPDVAKEKIRILPQNEKGLCPVEFIHDRWYDPKRKQMRNRKTRIGYIIDELPGIMIPNRRYGSCFDEISGKAFEDRVAETLEEIRKDNEERKRREEEERLSRETAESYKALFGENSGHQADESRMRLSQIVSEMHERKSKELEEKDDDEDYEDVEEEMEVEGNESVGVMSSTPAPLMPVTQATQEMSQRQGHFAGVSMEDERAAILVKILDGITRTIQVQAKKHPDALINVYKARKINEILMEIRIRYQGSGYEDLLELIEEPHEVEEDGERYIAGMTYSDVEVLLCHYGTILQHIHLKSKK